MFSSSVPAREGISPRAEQRISTCTGFSLGAISNTLFLLQMRHILLHLMRTADSLVHPAQSHGRVERDPYSAQN